MVARRKPHDPLLYWAVERENIRLKREFDQPAPWTTDPIFQKYRFCNVRRRDDRVSKWLIANVLEDEFKYKDKALFVMVAALCRWVNWPPTIKSLIDQGYITPKSLDLIDIGQDINLLVGMGVKAWTGAYMVRAPSKKKYPGVTKGSFVAEIVVGALDSVSQQIKDVLSPTSPSAQKTFDVLRGVPNYGTFMAGQIVADLTYTALLAKAYDLNTWAPQGPGSRRGFNRLLGRPLKAKIDEVEWSERLQEWRMLVAKAIGTELNLMDLQNCLCETDKYIRVKLGQGRPRSTYKPETAY